VLYGDAGPLLSASARVAGHAATLAESRKTSTFLNREVDLKELLRMNDDAPWERSFCWLCRPTDQDSNVESKECLALFRMLVF
jgi:hypothetical protein